MSPYNLMNEKINNKNIIDFKKELKKNKNYNISNISYNNKKFNNNNIQKCNF